MVRFPRPGAAKTRLIPALGVDGATDLYREMAKHCVTRLRPLHATGETEVDVHFEGGSRRAVRQWLGAWPRVTAQPAGDLGDRLRAALSAAFERGASRAVVMGSDCPCARATHVRQALGRLETHDIVIGPAEDGGYWLLGVSSEAAPVALGALFDGIDWGGSDVFRQTMERAERAGLTVALAERLSDVDHPADVASWQAEERAEQAVVESVSVVIPALDEQSRIAAAVTSALDGGAHEVIVADGGSTDDTVRVAADAGARVVECARGRADQMNAGAARATGDALLFLHADTRLPADFASLVCAALASGKGAGGAFTWATDDSPFSALFGWIGRVRVAVFRIPYGDQALFMTRRTFEDLGGYPVQSVMEDWELARRLRRLGGLRVLPERAFTSSRRWNEAGLLRPTAAYLAIIAAYRLGVDPDVLDGWRQG